MPILDILTNPVDKVLALADGAVTGGETGVAIDLLNVIAINFSVLATAYTSGSPVLDIELSADGSTGWVSVDSKYLIQPTDANGDIITIAAVDEIISVGLSGVDLETQRYARLVVDGTLVLDVVSIAEISRSQR